MEPAEGRVRKDYWMDLDAAGTRNRVPVVLLAAFRFARTVAGFSLLFLAALIGADVLTRSLTGRPIAGVFEAAGILLVTVTFLALPAVESSGKSLRIGFVIEYLGPLAGRLVILIEFLLILAFYGIVLWTGLPRFLEVYAGGFVTSGLVPIPLSIPIGLLVAGVIGTIVAGALRAVLVVARPRQFDVKRKDP
jgi:TRAP-type C4-dicarboxylate transport system permease small subunit